MKAYVEARSIPVPFVGCWLWLLSFGSHGYGNAKLPNEPGTVAHRVSYRAFKGPIPEGMLIEHACDNKWCVNPDHLSLGTNQSNSNDKHRKGRHGLDQRACGGKKLSASAVEEIRSGGTIRALAKRFGVSEKAVWNARHGVTYDRQDPGHA